MLSVEHRFRRTTRRPRTVWEFIGKPQMLTAGRLINVSQYISLQELRDRQRDEAGAQIFNTHRASGFSYRAKVPPDGAVSA